MVSRRRTLQSGFVALSACTGCMGVVSDRTPAPERRISWNRPERGAWPTAGYDSRNTGHNPNATPPRSSPTEDWKASISGTVTSVVASPDAIYASSDSEVVALAHDGDEQWRKSVGGGLHYIAGRLYVSTNDPIVALDAATGERVWTTSIEEVDPNDVYEVAGTVYVTGRESVCGLHPETGERRWQLSTARYPSLVANREAIYVVTHRRVHRLVPGQITRKFLREPTPKIDETIRPGWRPQSQPPTLTDDVLFVPQYGGHIGDTRGGVRKYGLDHADEYWMTPFTWQGISAISLTDTTVYAAPFRASTDPPDGSLVALDRETGNERWRYDGEMLGRPAIGHDVVVTGAADPGSPTVCVSTNGAQETECANGQASSRSGVLHGFDAESGERLWTISPAHAYGSYPLALGGDRIYYGDERGVHALS